MNIELIKEILDYTTIGILGLMGFISLWIWIERLLFFKSLDLNSYKTKEALDIDLTNNIGIISTIGANAPYVGLLGTVFGIIITFYILGQSENMDAKLIMTSLALALKATAMGLLVAIPSIIFYNHIVRKIEVFSSQWDILQKERDASKKV